MKKTLLAVFVACCTLSLSARNQINFLPLPYSVEYSEGEFTMDKNVSIVGGDEFNRSYLEQHLERVFDRVGTSWETDRSRKIEFLRIKSGEAEAYTLTVSPQKITIVSSDKAGEFYAIQTLLQMFPPQIYRQGEGASYGMMLREVKLPCVHIDDCPRFSYRGNMLDVSRTFFDKEYILRHIDFLAYHKINKMHWHLVDDNGWRVEIKKYPKLTQIGAWRGEKEALPAAYNSGKERYGGFYTQQDIKEIVAYAAQRNIEIIPEIDLPGHSKSLAVSYPEVLCKHDKELLSVQGEVRNVVCVGSETTYRILDDIFKEIAALFPSEYIHIGIEEVVTESWKYCPECQKIMDQRGYNDDRQLMQYFYERMEKIVHKHGKKVSAWEDVCDADASRTSRVLAWHAKRAAESVEKGFRTIVQPAEYCYYDMKYTKQERGHTWAAIIPLETAYSFDPTGSLGVTPENEHLVLGPQAGLFTEMLYYPPHFAEYQQFPRMCALAEMGWTPQKKRDFKDFDNRLAATHYERMYNMGIRFRIPLPQVTASDGVINARSEYSNMVVRYTADGSTPTVSSPVASGAIITDNPQNLRFATFFADLSSVAVEVPGVHKYLTPKTKVSTSFIPEGWSRLSVLEEYDFEQYFRTRNVPKAGDYVLYEFEEPVACSKITVQTNDPINDFFGLTDGHVEVSYDGKTFETVGALDMYNRLVIEPSQAVKAVKVVADSSCEGKAVSFQCLKIE